MNIYAAIRLAPKPERVPLECAGQNTIALDFDDTLCASSGPYMPDHFGAPIPEGLKLLRLLLSRGYNVVILTARKATDAVAVWLKLHGFPNMVVTNTKVPALAYVDDRAVHWKRGMTAEQALHEILEHQRA